LPVLAKLTEAYKLWHGFLPHIERLSRYTLGAKIDALFIEAIELILSAGFAPREGKLSIVHDAIVKIDSLKFFAKLAWELRALDHKHYAALVAPLAETGKMLGGWRKHLSS
jgi:hypothetical protein